MQLVFGSAEIGEAGRLEPLPLQRLQLRLNKNSGSGQERSGVVLHR
jgi:hypothetical protein